MATKQLEEIHRRAMDNLGEEEAEVFEGHLEILADEEVIEEIQDKIRDNLLPVEMACHEVYEANAREIAELDNEYMRERASDIRDIGKRLTYSVAGVKMANLNELDSEVIVIAEDLMPSDTAQMDRSKVLGFAIDKGVQLHMSRLWRSRWKFRPLSVCGNISGKIKDGDMLILDPARELLIVNPDDKSLDFYRQRLKEYQWEQEELASLKELRAETQDGHCVELCANIGSDKDIEGALRNGAEGVGLFRTEFLYMDRNSMPSEDEQFESYRNVAEGFTAARPVIVRTMDIGGDKKLSYLIYPKRKIPFWAGGQFAYAWITQKFCARSCALFCAPASSAAAYNVPYGNIL